MAIVSEKELAERADERDETDECPHRARRQRFPGKAISPGRRRVAVAAEDGGGWTLPGRTRAHAPRPPRLPR